MSRRSETLAGRIEEGAAGLAAFAEGLSETEWRVPVWGSDRRSIGVIVHHVASVYPIEIDLARAIASGKTVADVTWEVVAELNAKHAHDQAGVTKASALELTSRRRIRIAEDEEDDNGFDCDSHDDRGGRQSNPSRSQSMWGA
jgi:hypothetical protein